MAARKLNRKNAENFEKKPLNNSIFSYEAVLQLKFCLMHRKLSS